VDVETVPLRSQYIQRITADIAANRAEQEELSARLAQLQDDEAYLVGLQTASAPARSAAGDDQEVVEATPTAPQEPAVPQQRDTEPVAEETGAADGAAEGTGAADGVAGSGEDAAKKGGRKKKSTAPRKQAAAPSEKPAARGRAAKKPAPAAAKKTAPVAAKSAEVPLRERVSAVLLQTPGQQRSASEVHAELTRTASGTPVTPQAVRQSLESLISTGAAVRERQGRSVYYAVVSASESATATASATESADAEQQGMAAVAG